MNLDDLTIGEIKQIQRLTAGTVSCDNSPFEIGKKYCIRTVTMIQVGTLDGVYPTEITLRNASWVADTGRFQQSLLSGKFDEIEMFPKGKQVIVGRQAIIDAVQVDFDLPEEQK